MIKKPTSKFIAFCLSAGEGLLSKSPGRLGSSLFPLGILGSKVIHTQLMPSLSLHTASGWATVHVYVCVHFFQITSPVFPTNAK